jgi:Cdc6-like AAA superfamily ATPase
MIKPNPFTPQSGWEPRYFGGREEELNFFQKVLSESISGRANHMVVLGEWGTGKTSLAKQLKKIAQSQGCPTAFCSMSNISSKSALRDTMQLIAQEMLLGLPKETNPEAGNLFKGLAQLQPQVKFTKFLIELWPAIESKTAVVFIDDIQNLDIDSGVIDTLRSVLSRDEIIKDTNYLFVLLSTPKGWQDFIDKHNPVGRFFRKRIYLENLNEAETNEIIDKTLSEAEITFDENIKKAIFDNTKGHPYELQLLCSNLYDNQLEASIDDDIFTKALKNTLRELGKDYFEALYRRASEREKEVLSILVEKNKPLNISDIRSIMITEKRKAGFPIANIKNFLYRLYEKEIIKRKETGEFEVIDPMFSKYLEIFELQKGA